VDANAFYQSLVQKCTTHQPEGYGAVYTRAIYQVLYEIGIDAGFCVNCKPFEHLASPVGDREVMTIDFMYFAQKFAPDGYTYSPPEVVIEHENEWEFQPKLDDFWKATLFISPLRVFIGYAKDKDTAVEHAARLTEAYREYGMRQLAGAETLILISWNDANQCEWIARSLAGSGSEWRVLE